MRQGKGTRADDQIPLRAMGPVYFNEYESRAEYYDEWLAENLDGEALPSTPEERHKRLMEKRSEAFRQLCDIVYERKGFTAQGIPKRETVLKFDLMDDKARQLLDEYDA